MPTHDHLSNINFAQRPFDTRRNMQQAPKFD